MVNIAVAGAVAKEVIDALLATRKHEITILSRSAAREVITKGVGWRTVNYKNNCKLLDALQGIHTVLSFLQVQGDAVQHQKNLIDAAIEAGVKRFAPSEYGSAGLIDMPWWAGKQEIREYLEEVNKGSKPGLFLNYFASPYKTAKYMDPLDTMVDFQNRRAAVVDGVDATISCITVQDMAVVIARAVEYEGPWPAVGGIRANQLTISRLLEIGEKVRGRPFAIEKVTLEDLEAGELKTSWRLGQKHPAFTEEESAKLAKVVLVGTLLSSAKGAWDSSDEFNQLLPDVKFTKAEDFLARVWEGRP